MANSKEQKLILGGKTKLYYSKASVIGLFLGPRNLKTYNVASHWTTQINTFFKKFLCTIQFYDIKKNSYLRQVKIIIFNIE